MAHRRLEAKAKAKAKGRSNVRARWESFFL